MSDINVDMIDMNQLNERKSRPRSRRVNLMLAAALGLIAFAPQSLVLAATDAGTADAGGASASSTAVAPGSTAAPAMKLPLDEAHAISLVAAMPEVEEVARQLKLAKVRLVIRRDDENASGPFELAVAEDHDDHEVTRYRFSVDPATAAITAYEVECDLWAPLAKWRAMRAKMEKMTDAQRDAFDTCAPLQPDSAGH